MPSEKTVVIDYLWDLLAKEGQGRRVVFREDVVEAIEHCVGEHGIELSTGNAANFMKDIVRGDNANDFWPKRLWDLSVTARQRPRDKRVFEFVDFPKDQTEPFPIKYGPHAGLSDIPIEAISLSSTKRSLGRKDESWLVQIAVELRIVQTHFAMHSVLPMQEIGHLQTGVKLGSSEVDSLFLARLVEGDGLRDALITCEAKQEGQRILDHQIIEQIIAASKSVRIAGLLISSIIPVALKAIDGGRVYFAEFLPWSVEQAALPEPELPELKLASEAVYALRPPVPGIGHRIVRRRRSRKPRSSS